MTATPPMAHFERTLSHWAASQSPVSPSGNSLQRRWSADQHVGPYQIVRQLDCGAFGTTVLARRTGAESRGFAKLVMLSVAEMADDIAIPNEQKLRALRHDLIVDLYDMRRMDSDIVLEMEHVEGVTLQEFLVHHDHRVPLQVVGYIAATLLRGIAWMHGARDAKKHSLHLVHGRMSASNVLLARTGALKLCLPGRTYSPQLPEPAMTLRYLAPEQCGSGQAVEQTDVYAIGVMLYEMLTGGQHPRWDREPTNELDAVLAASIETIPVSSRTPTVDRPLTCLVESMLARDPKDRPTAAEALRRLLRALPFEPIHLERILGRKVRKMTAIQNLGTGSAADEPTECLGAPVALAATTTQTTRTKPVRSDAVVSATLLRPPRKALQHLRWYLLAASVTCLAIVALLLVHFF